MKKSKNYLYRFLRIIYTFLLKIIFKPQVFGVENIPQDGAVIFAGNHKHAIDPIMVMSFTKRIVHFFAKKELFKGFHGLIFKKIGLIRVDRSKKNADALNMAEEILNNNGTIGIFPEGTRNRTENELLEFKFGAIALAKKTNCKIVPFAIRGTYKIFKESVIIEFGEPIWCNNMENKEANDYLRNKVLNLLRK